MQIIENLKVKEKLYIEIYILNGKVVFQFVSDSLIKDLGKHLTEKAGDHKDQNYDKHRRGQIEKKAACRYYCNEKAVNAHFLKAHHVLPDKAVIVQHGAEHFPKLL